MMMAMLYAMRILEDKITFARVPAKLKEQVARVLIAECGAPELVPIAFGGEWEG